MRTGVQHHQATRARKPAAGQPAGRSCGSRRLRRPSNPARSTAVGWRMLGVDYILSRSRSHHFSRRHPRAVEPTAKCFARMRAGLHRYAGGSNPQAGKPVVAGVLPSLVALFLMSRCECRWNYSLSRSWSRVQPPPVPDHWDRSSEVEHECFIETLSQRGISKQDRNQERTSWKSKTTTLKKFLAACR
jgi:hypothetical protein